uniref:Uncharacterized protein n=1 Tax=Solanum tuberosum TaxID=4113 RepID=M1D6B8_SOLTU
MKQANKKEVVLARTRTNKTELSRQHFAADSTMSTSSIKQLDSAEQHRILREGCLYQFELGQKSILIFL